MWNFLVNGLSTGCTLVLYDGSPLKNPALLWQMAEDLKFTIFGTRFVDGPVWGLNRDDIVASSVQNTLINSPNRINLVNITICHH
jgi:hypothetical protein